MSRAIAVFGSSEPLPHSEAYTLAVQTGSALARAGFETLTGGYGGVMAGASQGAHEAGGRTTGVICDIFSDRSPNPYLDRTVNSSDLYERTRGLIDRADGFIVLAGRTGTLAELAWVWALARAGALPERPIVALGEPWPELLQRLTALEMLDDVAQRMTLLAATPQEAVEKLLVRCAPDAH